MKSKAPLIVVSIAMATTSCINLFNPGKVNLIQSIPNNDKSKQAITFVKEGNATTEDSYHISVKSATDRLTDSDVGNAFTCDLNHGKIRLDSTTIKVHWLANDKLKVTYDQHIRVFKAEHIVDGVQINYKLLN